MFKNADLIRLANEAQEKGDHAAKRRYVAQLRATQNACPHESCAAVEATRPGAPTRRLRYCRDCGKEFSLELVCPTCGEYVVDAKCSKCSWVAMGVS
jgi:hypothetical protein